VADDGHAHPDVVPARRSLRLPAFWLLLGLVLIGGYRSPRCSGRPAGPIRWRPPPRSHVRAVAVPFALVVRSLDYFEREPPLLVLAAFGWGGLVATSTAIAANAAGLDLLARRCRRSFATGWGPALIAPTMEELLKTLGVVVVVLVARAQMNSVVDGIVYGAFVGLGFQVVENIIYAMNAVGVAGRGDQVGPVVTTFLLRGFLGGLWSHTLFSALAGAGVAILVVHRDRPLWTRLAWAGSAFAGAWVVHFLWNSPLLRDGFGYGGLGAVAALLLKGIPAALLILLLIGMPAAGGEYYLRMLASEPEIATQRELQALASGRTRAAARRYRARPLRPARFRRGTPAAAGPGRRGAGAVPGR